MRATSGRHTLVTTAAGIVPQFRKAFEELAGVAYTRRSDRLPVGTALFQMANLARQLAFDPASTANQCRKRREVAFGGTNGRRTGIVVEMTPLRCCERRRDNRGGQFDALGADLHAGTGDEPLYRAPPTALGQSPRSAART